MASIDTSPSFDRDETNSLRKASLSGDIRQIETFNPELLLSLRKAILTEGLTYSEGNDFSSLITPTRTIISDRDRTEINQDLKQLWSCYQTLNSLYRQSLSGSMPEWIKDFVEYGLTEGEKVATRLTSEAGLQPSIGRIDYVSITNGRKIAEVQWKSGGPGLFFGLQGLMDKVIPNDGNSKPLGDLTMGFHEHLKQFVGDGSKIVLNDVRPLWAAGENYLSKIYAKHGLSYEVVDRNKVSELIYEDKNRFFLKDEKGTQEIGFFYGYGWSRFSDSKLLSLAEGAIDGRIWIESPLNHLYRGKFGMALPFMPEFKNLFDDSVRNILIPTALVTRDGLNMSEIAKYFEPGSQEEVAKVRQLADFVDLGPSIRKQFVFKSGSGSGEFYSRGRGVFRINGSKASVRKILSLVQEQIENGEPWIVQQYIDRKTLIDVRHPNSIDQPEILDAHARYLVYGTLSKAGDIGTIGGLGNYGKHWKVSGKEPGRDPNGDLTGTAFNGIYVKSNE